MYTFDVPVPSAVLAVWGEGSLGDGGTGTGVGLAGDGDAAGGGGGNLLICTLFLLYDPVSVWIT